MKYIGFEDSHSSHGRQARRSHERIRISRKHDYDGDQNDGEIFHSQSKQIFPLNLKCNGLAFVIHFLTDEVSISVTVRSKMSVVSVTSSISHVSRTVHVFRSSVAGCVLPSFQILNPESCSRARESRAVVVELHYMDNFFKN